MSARTRFPAIAFGVLGLLSAGCGDDAAPEPEAVFEIPGAQPGEVVGLVARDDLDGHTVEWVRRLDGTIESLDLDGDLEDGDAQTVATIEVATEGEQRGLLGQVVIDGRRFAAWTRPETTELVVGEIVDGAPAAPIWNAGETGTGAIGGVLRELDGRIVVGVGRNTGFDRESGVGGAILRLDPDGSAGQQPEVVSTGYTNPWAYEVVAGPDDAEIWVADNAAGPDPDDETVDDIERIGRADLVADRNDMTRITESPRAPAAMVELPDGRLGICGFLDGSMRAYEVVDGDGPRTFLDRAGTIMPCLTGAAVFDDGTVVTVATTDSGAQALHVLRP